MTPMQSQTPVQQPMQPKPPAQRSLAPQQVTPQFTEQQPNQKTQQPLHREQKNTQRSLRDDHASEVVPPKKSHTGLFVTLGIIVFLIAALAFVWFTNLFGVRDKLLGEESKTTGSSPYSAEQVLAFGHEIRFDAQGRVLQCVYEAATGKNIVDFLYSGENGCSVNTYNYDKNGELIASKSDVATIECEALWDNMLSVYFYVGDSALYQLAYGEVSTVLTVMQSREIGQSISYEAHSDYYKNYVMEGQPSVSVEPTEPPVTEKPTEPAVETEPEISELDGTIAFITDSGTIDDHSFNQYTYEGVQLFSEANGIECRYYKPFEDSDQARIDAMNLAIADGAKVIVMAGFLFGTAVHEVATANPETLFLALDVSTGDLPGEAPANLALITYMEEQAGYLAGYAAVMGGFTKLGFLGGIDVPAVVRYGYGFIQGADTAAAELGTQIEINYWYSNVFFQNDEILAKMNGWYTAGTEIVFCCGGGIYLSCVAAAEANNGWVIGVDVDQSNVSSVILTSALKGLSNSAQFALNVCRENGWQWPDGFAGRQVVLGTAENCVGLPMENTYLYPFDQYTYDALYAAITDGSIFVSNAVDHAPKTTNTTVYYQN